MLDLQRLQLLREVSLRGSFSAAAGRLNFSTSAVAQQIAQLEREVGVQLVERRSTGAVPTAAGERLIRHADAILAAVGEAEAELRQFRDGTTAAIRCGAFASAAATLVPEAISELRKQLPDVAITLVTQDRLETLDAIQRNELDVGVVAANNGSQNGPATEGIERIPLFVEPIDVVMSRRHRLADASTVALTELGSEPWAECSSNPVRRFVGGAGLSPKIVFEGDGSALTRFVAEGGAICLLPRLGQHDLPRELVVKPIAPDPPTRRVEIAVRVSNTRADVRTFVSLLRRVASSYER